MTDLIEILRVSVAKHGPDKPITLGHLLNIVEMSEKRAARRHVQDEHHHARLLDEIDPFGQEGMR